MILRFCEECDWFWLRELGDGVSVQKASVKGSSLEGREQLEMLLDVEADGLVV